MSTPENPPAFPGCYAQPSYHSGMTLRDYFAAKAMAQLIAHKERLISDAEYSAADAEWAVANAAYLQADAMLAARNRAARNGTNTPPLTSQH